MWVCSRLWVNLWTLFVCESACEYIWRRELICTQVNVCVNVCENVWMTLCIWSYLASEWLRTVIYVNIQSLSIFMCPLVCEHVWVCWCETGTVRQGLSISLLNKYAGQFICAFVTMSIFVWLNTCLCVYVLHIIYDPVHGFLARPFV